MSARYDRAVARIELPESWGEAPMVMTELAGLGYDWTEVIILGRHVVELH
jgi:hypothetical protein